MATITADKSLYEIVVINNNSTDHTNEICQDFAEKHPEINFRYVFEAQSGKWNACNRAVAEARAELLSFMDDDQTIQPNYVDVIIKTFEDYPEYTAAGGRMFPLGEDGKEMKFYSRYLNPFYKTDLGNTAKEYPRKPSLLNPTVLYPPGGTITFRREWFEKYGDYGERPPLEVVIEDMYMAKKLREKNEKILYMPDIVIYHHIPKERYEYKALMKHAHISAKSQAEQKRAGFMSRLVKFAVCVGVGAFYFITLRPIQGFYLIAFQYNWLKGYINGMTAAAGCFLRVRLLRPL